MADLARAYPGALREIDELPLEAIRARVEELAAAERGHHARRSVDDRAVEVPSRSRAGRSP